MSGPNDEYDLTTPEFRRLAMLDSYAQVMHDAYEAAATEHGWQTQERSRKPWAEVPEENKATMRKAVAALLGAIPIERECAACGATTRERMAD